MKEEKDYRKLKECIIMTNTNRSDIEEGKRLAKLLNKMKDFIIIYNIHI